MPKRPDLTWTKPEGGLFLWLSLPSYVDTDKMFYKAIEKKIAYVVGSSFYYDDPEVNSMRINFSYSSYEQIEEGVKRLADTFKEEIEEHEGHL
jgi:2-aminoadipate transaminase